MALMRLGSRTAIQRWPGGLTTFVCAAALLVGLAGLPGCGSPPAQNVSQSSSPSSSPSCQTSGFMHRSGHLRAGQPPALAAALVPMPIPDPDINLDVPRPEQEQDQEQWADNGLDNADDNPEQLVGNSAPDSGDNLQQESDAVAEREEVTLWEDDLTDPETFGEDVCRDIENLNKSGENLDNVSQVCSYLQQQSNNEKASNAVCGVIQDANNQFDDAFGACNGLQVTEWLLDTLDQLFCTNVPSG
jgi:hypothetical protein